MTSDLSSLITHLKKYRPIGTTTQPCALGFIVDYKRFVNVLEKINDMIALQVIKDQIADQVSSFIVNYRRYGKPTNKRKLHTLLYGPSGCGKTQIGEYLAELWATSGCLPPKESGDEKLFVHQPEVKVNNSLAPKLNLQSDKLINDAEKVALRQNLIIQSSQVKQYQQKMQATIITINNTLTQFNNVRKKVKSKTPDHEGQIQAKFQEIKKNLREITGGTILISQEVKNSPVGRNAPEILPVTVPKFPGLRSIFGNTHPPLLPQIPTTPDNNILSQLSSLIKSELPDVPKAPVKFSRVTKGDLVGKFQGHTTDQVRKILLEHVGGVLMIDEAYNLCTSVQDDFGKEALTEIINFMTTHPDRIIFIFAGYRKEMEDTILKIQPGLTRRFNWTFEIKEYTPQELNLIFQQQLKNKSDIFALSNETSVQLEKFFKDNASKFPFFGGDTERLCDMVEETFNQKNWLIALDDSITQENYNKLFTDIDFDCITKSFEKYLENSVKHREENDRKLKEEKEKELYSHIYS
jgi:hypothetical protein